MPSAASDNRRPRFARYSIRLLLLFILVVATGMALLTNQLQQEIPPPIGWDPVSGENIKWMSAIGSQTYSNPTVHGDYVFVGANNGAAYDSRISKKTDLGVMLCFDRDSGKFLWQSVHLKLPIGRVSDWPLQGITSQACADKNRLWYLSNRCEVVCLDTEGFRDGQNDVPFVDEASTRETDADLIWLVDLRERFGVFPHNVSHCNIVVDQQRVYLKTSNGVDEAHRNLPAPTAPSFVVLDRENGATVWTDNSPGDEIFHGSWGSPTLATLDGKYQVLFPGGNGVLYSFDPVGDGAGNPVLLWEYDCNPKTSRFVLGGRGERNNLVTAPTVVGNRIYLTMGQDPEHGSWQSRVICIEPGSKRGDLSPTLVERGTLLTTDPDAPRYQFEFRKCVVERGDREVPNPNSARAWEYIGADLNNDGTIEESNDLIMSRSLSKVVVRNGLAWVTDINGFLHCLDAETGKRNWHYDLFAPVWNSPLLAGDRLMVADEDGMVTILNASGDLAEAAPNGKPLATVDMLQPMYANPSYRDGVLYIATRHNLYAIEDPAGKNSIQRIFKR